jgi:histone-lysine N-methyltransferase SETMAR
VYDVLLFHDNGEPYTNMHTTEAITKFGWTVLLHVPHSPNLAPTNFHLFGTLKEPVRTLYTDDEAIQKIMW